VSGGKRVSSRKPLPLVILISGRGSNMLAIARACQQQRIAATIARVIADRTDAAGLGMAAELGLTTELVDRNSAPDRESFEGALIASIDQALGAATAVASGNAAAVATGNAASAVDSAPAVSGRGTQVGLVVLAGFMRVLSAAFVQRYTGRMLNIHPSLLPRLRGLHTHRRALEGRDKQHGASVHYVTPELDSGPVVLQSRIGVRAEDTEASLAARVLQTEHAIYPRVINWIATGRLQWRSGRPWLDGTSLDEPVIEDFAV
jgi:phosphoribosylglycinamide formyltransferase 1